MSLFNIPHFEKSLMRGDKTLQWIVLFLMFFSLIVIYSSTGKMAFANQDGNTWYYLLKHFGLTLCAVCAIFCARFFSWRWLYRYSLALVLFALLLTLYTAFWGRSIHGASRWIGEGYFSFQPSELVKILTVIFMARILSDAQEEKGCVLDSESIVKLMLPLSVIALILKDNFSTAALLGGICFSMMIIARVKTKLLLSIAGAVVGAVFLIVLLVKIYPPLGEFGRFGTISSRIMTHVGLGDEKEKRDDNYQSDQACIAIAKGGLLGVGPGNSKQKNFLPFPFSDFIFAIIIEEFGLMGGSVVVLFYLIILYRIVRISNKILKEKRKNLRGGPDIFPALVVFGLGFMLVLQAIFHIGVNIGLFPVTGQTLPLMSMGGTSLLFVGGAIGIILDLSYRFSPEGLPLERMEYEEEQKRRIRENIIRQRVQERVRSSAGRPDPEEWEDENPFEEPAKPRNRTGVQSLGGEPEDDDFSDLEKQQRDILRKLK